jgi:hypothetical protein
VVCQPIYHRGEPLPSNCVSDAGGEEETTYVAVDKPYTGVVSGESHHQVSSGGQHRDVTSGRVAQVQGRVGTKGGGSLLSQDVHVVAVEMDGMRLVLVSHGNELRRE